MARLSVIWVIQLRFIEPQRDDALQPPAETLFAWARTPLAMPSAVCKRLYPIIYSSLIYTGYQPVLLVHDLTCFHNRPMSLAWLTTEDIFPRDQMWQAIDACLWSQRQFHWPIWQSVTLSDVRKSYAAARPCTLCPVRLYTRPRKKSPLIFQ